MRAISEFPMRLQVFLAKSTTLSRRKAEEAIESGRVEVNDLPVMRMGYMVEKGDRVFLDGVEVSLSSTVRCYMLNKPPGCVCSNSDPHQRNYARDYLLGVRDVERLFSVGRLDKNSQGLLLFTDDGKLANRIIHPSQRIVRAYQVQVSERVQSDDLYRMRNGISFPDSPLPYRISFFRIMTPHIVEVRLESGKNREIRRLFESFGYFIEKLARISIGRLELGDLKEGHYRRLKAQDIEKIFQT